MIPPLMVPTAARVIRSVLPAGGVAQLAAPAHASALASLHASAYVPAATMQLTLVPIAPIVLLPFILVIFVIFAPLWGAALLVIAVLRAIFWPIEKVLAALHAPGAGEASDALARASRWVSTLGGLTERYTAGRRNAAAAAAAADQQQAEQNQQYQQQYEQPRGPGA